MNANNYRIIFSKTRGQLMVVAETATGEGKSAGDTRRSTARQNPYLATLRPLAFSLLAALGLMLAGPATAQVVAYRNAPASQQPTILTAGNNVPLVNIQTPSAAGVSRNTYSQFDVLANGVILNNSRTNVQTDLGGWVQGNPWLATGSARVILNEVVSANPSQLQGYVEVAGSRAQVVIANPAGITCNGCGFINASRATLTTGTPILSGGALTGYSVQGGQVAINGNGLDSSTADYTDLIARSVVFNAGIWANDLRVTAGINDVNAENTLATPSAAGSAAPAFAIDVAQLGGMYAGKITLVGTEAGVGVRNAGQIGASVGDVVVSVDGQLTNSGQIHATGNTQINAVSGISNSGTIYSQGNTGMSTRGDIVNDDGLIAAGNDTTLAATGAASRIAGTSDAILAAGIASNGQFSGTGRLSTNATHQVALEGQNQAAGDVVMTAKGIDLSGSQTTATSISVTASTGDLTATGAQLVATGSLTASTTQRLIHDGATTNAQQLQLAARDLSNIGGEIVQTGSGDTSFTLAGNLDNTQGRIATNSQNLSLTAQTLTNTEGEMTHAGSGALTVRADTLTGTLGYLGSNGTLDLATHTATLDDAVTVAKQITIDTTDLSNKNGQIVQTGSDNTNVEVVRHFDNRGGSLTSRGGTTVTAGSFDNSNGQLVAAGTADIDLFTSGLLNNASGTISAANSLQLAAASVSNGLGYLSAGLALKGNVSGVLDNAQGTIVANNDIELLSTGLENAQGTIGSVLGNVLADAGSELLDNTNGRVEAARDVTLTATGMTNASGLVVGKNVSINTHTQAFSNDGGALVADSALAVQSGTLSNDAGLIQAAGALTINTHGKTLTNNDSGASQGIRGQSSVTLATGALDNASGFIGAADQLKITASDINNAAGSIVGEKNLLIDHADNLDNTGGQIQAMEAIEGTIATVLKNTSGLIRSGVAVTISASQIDNSSTSGADLGIEGKALALSAQQIDNTNGAMRADTTLTLTGSHSINNTGGLISSADTLSIIDPTAAGKTLALTNVNTDASKDLNGVIIADKTLFLDAASLTGNGKILSGEDLTIKLSANATHSGEITANDNATIEVDGVLTNAGTLQAGTTLAVRAGTIDNAFTGKIAGTLVQLQANDTHTLTNRGLIDGDNTFLDAITLNNIGTGRIYGDHVAISAATLNNVAEGGAAPVIAARNRLDIGATAINNAEHALLFSTGDLSIGGALDANHRATGQTTTLNNTSATIEALGSLAINAGTINNANAHFSTQNEATAQENIDQYVLLGSSVRNAPSQVSITWDKAPGVSYLPPSSNGMGFMSGSGFFSDNSNNYIYLHTPQGTGPDFWLYSFTRYTTETRVKETDPGKILAGGNMQLSGGTLNNDKSQVIAGGTLTASLGAVNNTEAAGQRIATDRGTTWHIFRDKKHDDSDRDSYAYNPAPMVTGFLLTTSQYAGNTTVPGSGTDVDDLSIQGIGQNAGGANTANANVASQTHSRFAEVTALTGSGPSGIPMVIRSVTPSNAIPNNALYSTPTSTTAHYLLETDARFANYRQWISSDYMLQQLSLNPATTQKRLGDGFYEQRLITEQIAKLTGQRFLTGYSNEEDQYIALMNSGVLFAQTWDLIPGVALTAEQMARLTSDIVWLVETDVALADGSTQKALVPQIYARVQQGDLLPSGSLIAANDIDLNVSGDLVNSGTIAGRQLVALTAENIKNLGGRMAGQNALVQARNDLAVLGGSIEAKALLAASAGHDLTVASTTRTQTSGQGSRTNIDRVAGLYVTENDGTLIASAGNDFALLAAALINAAPTAAGTRTGTTTLMAGHDLELGTVTTAFAEAVGGGKHRRSETAQDETGTVIQTDGDLTLLADHDLTATAAEVAATGALTATAGNDLTITTGESQAHVEEFHKQKFKSGFSSTKITTRDTLDATSTVSSRFSGDVLTLSAGQDVTVKGSDLTATGDLAISAGRDLTVESAHERSDETHFESRKTSGVSASLSSGISYGKSSQKQNQAGQTGTQVSSTLSGADVSLTSARDTTISASNVLADQDLTVLAGRDINVLAAADTQDIQSRYKSSSTSIGLIGGLSARFTMFGKADASQNGETSASSARTTLLSANSGDLTLIAGIDDQYKGTGTGNVTTQGADLLAGDAISLSGNAVDLQAVANVSTSHSVAKSKSVTVGAALAGGLGGQITAISDAIERARDTDNDRLKGALALKAGYDAYKLSQGQPATKTLATGTDPNAPAAAAASTEPGAAAPASTPASTVPAAGSGFANSGLGVSVSIGVSKSKSESSTSDIQVAGTNLQAKSIDIEATETDLAMAAAKLQAEDITLTAQRDILLEAAASTSEIHSKNKSSNTGFGVTFAFGGQQNGLSFQLSASQAKGKANGSETVWDNTLITASNALNVTSGRDTTLRGAQLAGDTVKFDIGRNLLIESLQDNSAYYSKQSSSGFSLSLCIPPICGGVPVTGSVSASDQKIKHNYQSAVGQSGIAAGEGGFDITVGNKTELVGAAITGSSDPSKNRLTTASLTNRDLVNTQSTKSSASSLSVGYAGASTSTLAMLAGNATSNLLANLGNNAALPENGSEKSETKSVISPATINITGTGDATVDEKSQATADELTARDLKTVNQSLTNTLTLQQAQVLDEKIKEQKENQEAANLVGGVLSNMVGDLAVSRRIELQAQENARAEAAGEPAKIITAWADGSAEKIVLHGLVGLIEAQIGGGNAAAGVQGAISQEVMAPILSTYLEEQGFAVGSDDYKALMQLGATLTGTAIGALADGTKGATTAGNAAFQGVSNNYLKHDERMRYLNAKLSCLKNSQRCDEASELERTSQQRNDELATACADRNSQACSTAEAAARQALATQSNDANSLEYMTWWAQNGVALADVSSDEANLARKLFTHTNSIDLMWKIACAEGGAGKCDITTASNLIKDGDTRSLATFAFLKKLGYDIGGTTGVLVRTGQAVAGLGELAYASQPLVAGSRAIDDWRRLTSSNTSILQNITTSADAVGTAIGNYFQDIKEAATGSEWDFYDVLSHSYTLGQAGFDVGTTVLAVSDLVKLASVARATTAADAASLGRIETVGMREGAVVADGVGVNSAERTLFTNQRPADVLGTPNLVPLNKLSEINGTFNYVVTEGGDLVVGRIARNVPGGGHIDLANGLPVQAAGQVKVVDGGIRFIDNASGHYIPTGSAVQAVAESAFSKLGFDISGKYVPKVWVPDPKLPRGGAWRPME